MKFTILLVLGMILPGMVFAHENPRVAVVNIQQIITQSVAWQAKLAVLQQQAASSRDAFAAQERSLQDEINAYQQERALLSPEQQQERDQQLNVKITTLQNQAGQQQGLLNDQSQRAQQALRIQAAEIIKVIADEKRLDIILEVSQENFSVVFFTNRLDISQDVIERLNRDYPEILTD